MMSTAMCVWHRRVAVHIPHVYGCNPVRCLHPFIADMCVHTIDIPRQDGNRLYQPSQRRQWGKISVSLTTEIMTTLVAETSLFTAPPGGRSWLFDPYGAVPDEDGKIDTGVVHRVAIRHRLLH